MFLWDIIRDFFVQYIFGGNTSTGGEYSGLFGAIISIGGQGEANWGLNSNTDFYLKLSNTFNDNTGSFDNYISIGDYLSTTATIIVMVLLCFLLVKLAIWIFKLGANLIRLR